MKVGDGDHSASNEDAISAALKTPASTTTGVSSMFRNQLREHE